MTSEGGGKLRQKKSRTLAKPYDRPKSLVGRLKDAVVNILAPSWVTSLVSRSESSVQQQSECPSSDDDENENEAEKTTSSTGTAYPFPHIASPIAKPGGGTTKLNSRLGLQKASLPMHSPSFYSRSNHDRETGFLDSSPTLSGGLAGEDETAAVAGPSTSTPIAGATSSAYSAALANARQFAAARRRRGGQEEETSRAASNPIFNSASSNINNNGSRSSKAFAKLSDFAKLNQDAHNATEKKSFINSDHIALDSQSECSEESMSTSGCSSMVPHPDKREYQREILPLNKSHLPTIDEDLAHANEQNKTWGFGSELSERKSFLWSESNKSSRSSKPQPTALNSRPQFNPSLLGTSLWSETRSVGNSSSRTESPYLGKVTYGFGSAIKRARSCTPYDLESSNRHSVQAKVYRASDESVMSSTAKRILLSLEKMSTPLADAKKIPTANVLSPVLETPLNFNPSARRRPNLSNRKLSHLETSYAQKLTSGPPPTQRLMTPASVYVRSIAKPTLNETSTKETLSVPSSSAGPSSQTLPKINSKAAGGGGGKIRARPEPMHYSASAADKHEVVEMPDLPAVSLPIQTLPVFDLHPRPAFKASVNSLPSTVKSVSSPLNVSKSQIISNNVPATPPRLFKTLDSQPSTPSVPTFTFSTPLVKQDIRSINGSPQQMTPPALPNYTFHSPAVESASASPGQIHKFDGLKDFVSSSSSTKLVKRKQMDEVEEEAPAAGLKVASELKIGSVMDILGKPSSVSSDKDKEKTSVDSTSLVNQFRPASGSWECAECWVNNKSDTAKCVACGISRPDAKTVKPSSVPASSAASISSLPPPPAYVNTWGDKFRPAADTWECPGCMLRVETKLDKCRACETPNPKATNTKSGASSNKSAGEWVCDICFVKNEESKSSCSACQSIKLKKSTGPMPQSSGFKFGFSTSCTTSTSTNITSGSISAFTSVSSATTAGSSLFKFSVGVSAAQPTPSTGFKFGFADTTTSTEQAVASSTPVSSTPATENVSSSSRTATTTSGFKFGQQASSTNVVTSTTAPLVSSSSEPGGSGAPAEDKDAQPTASKGAAAAFAMPVAPSFSFKVGGGSSASSAVSTSLFTAAATSTAPSTKPDAKTTDSTFAFTAPVTTSAASTVASTAANTSSSTAGGFAFSFATPSSTNPPVVTATTAPFNFNPSTTVTSSPAIKPNLFGSSNASAPSSGFSFGSGSANLLSTKSISGPKEETKVPTFGALGGGVSSSEGVGFMFKATPTPVFGALSTVGDKSPASNTFTFGSASSTVVMPPATTTSGLALFGSSDSLKTASPLLTSGPKFSVGPSVPSFNPAPTFTSSAQPSFTFGSTTSKMGAVGSGTSTASFGTLAASVAPNSAAPSPGFGSFNSLGSQSTATGTPGSTSGFAFGASSTAAPGLRATTSAPSLAPQNSGFAFGQALQPQQNPGIFNFTGNQAPPPQPTVPNLQATSSFGFGNASQQAPSQGFNFNPTQTPNFNFGAPAAPAPGTSQPAYEFSANPFDAHQSAANRPARQIRKAKRRTNK